MELIAVFVFIIVQILCIPLAIIGVGMIGYKQFYISKKLGVSGTAIIVINGRWSLDIFGIRKDEATVKLNRVLPNSSVLGLWFCLIPLYLQYKVSGKRRFYPVVVKDGYEGIANLIINRTIYFDQIIDRAKDRVEQFVIMGAGFDTRCYGALNQSHLTCFELDQPLTQLLKKQCLAKAGIDASSVHFVEIDFTTELWYENLQQAGYDANKKTLFLWEGVTLYLSEKDVRNTLKQMKKHSESGSVLVADFYSLSFVQGELYPSMKSQLKLLKITGEEFRFGLDFSSRYQDVFEHFIESEGGTVGQTYFMGRYTKKGTWMLVAEVLF